MFARPMQRSIMIAATAALLSTLAAASPALAGTIYDSQVLERMQFDASLRAKVSAILNQSELEIADIFRRYGIDPNAKPDFGKLQAAAGELTAAETREKSKMKEILSAAQYKDYLNLLQEAAARVIKATRNDSD